ncbi:Na(+)-translocating NADH-quinone reductase subunit A [Gammaproteobacteria bacterium]|nr:Na(+)-translocating NADH-quinone reductase subunit A [Gammaproteobacteria bacterium]
MKTIRKGLDVPISGAPGNAIDANLAVDHVAVLGVDYHDMRPTMRVAEGENVVAGDPLFEDKKNPGVIFTAPASGEVVAINRGYQRSLQSVVIRVAGDEQRSFNACGSDASAEAIEALMVEAGLWPAFRTRPYSKSPALGSRPQGIFVTAMDTNPLAADPMLAVNEEPAAFAEGLKALTQLSDGKVYVCRAQADDSDIDISGVEFHQFSGPHPAGLVGTHMHFLMPVGLGRVAWSIGAQDVIALGKLVKDGILHLTRVVAVGGAVEKPRVVRTRLGAKISEVVDDLLDGGTVISGSPLSGTRADGDLGFLGRFHTQVAALWPSKKREFMHYIRIGKHKFSASNVFPSSLNKRARYEMTDLANGSPRAMMPIGIYEDLMPLDILPTQLLRSIVVGDTDTAQRLGCLELDEEDLALLTFASSSKYDYGFALREALTKIEKEG